jgi:hypothetical protein
VCRADAQVGHPAGPVRLVSLLGYHHLRCAGPGGHPAEQCLLSRHKLDEVLADVRSSVPSA